jgi:SPP1 family predicted phage head-tail adaptor
MALRAGDLRESVVIQVATQATNDYGESLTTWSDFARRRASIRGLRVSETVAAQEPQTVGTHEVQFRYAAGLRPDMRLLWVSRNPARTLDILSVTEENNRESHRLECKERKA